MSDLWHEVDSFLTGLLGLSDKVLDDNLTASAAAGLPQIQVSAAYGRFLELMARATGAQRILEIGTLGGYSTTWLARALPADGHLVTLELDQHHADVARANLVVAGVSDKVEIIVGPAANSLQGLVDGRLPPFDLVFIDADKEGYPAYLDWSIRLARSGALIIADNVVRGGGILEADSPDPRVRAVRHFAELLAADDRVTATIIQTVGAKGYDGMAIALVK